MGLFQGLALYLLYSAFDHKSWPATIPLLFAPFALVALFVPLVIMQGLANIRATTLIIWTGAASLIVAGLAFYDIWHAWPGGSVAPSASAFFSCAIFLFVAHALVSCGDADRRIVARYPTLFDLAWKLGVQIAIAACFVLTFWLMLWLGVALFDMIKLTGFGEFLGHPWVWIPFTTIATAVSLHLTDTRANLVRGVRTLALTLLGWLLPVITLIAFAFLISLMVTGLQPLWETRYAAFLLLAAAMVLVIHINAAYQDGDVLPPHVLRVAGTLASVLLIFIIAIAAYALWLRVNQYGWTVERITLAGCMLVAAMFAVGYLIAAVLPSPWLKLIERWNVYGTFAFLIALFALSTPIADPMRLSVNDQLARLNSGAVKPDKFDFYYFYAQGGRFGHDALISLSKSRDVRIRKFAAYQLDSASGKVTTPLLVAPYDIAANIATHPAGTALPQSFLVTNWKTAGLNDTVAQGCLLGNPFNGWRCDGIVNALGGGEVLLLYSPVNDNHGVQYLDLFDETGGHWQMVASTQVCWADKKALLSSQIKALPPVQQDLEISGKRHAMSPVMPDLACP